MGEGPEQNQPEDRHEPEPAALSDGGAGLAAQLAEQSWQTPLRKVYGGLLLCAAIGSCALLFLAYAPQEALEPSSQVAAAEAVDASPFDDIEIAARAAYVYDAADGKELYAKNASQQLPLASITKVMLVLAVSEVLPLDGTVSISQAATIKGGGGLTWGEVWRVRDLIDYTLITSSNTGAEALAEAADAPLRAKYAAAPSGGAAVWRMNALAQEFELESTYFINVSGLDESATQAGALGSARDTALLFARAVERPELFAGTTRTNAALMPLNFPGRIAENTNNALSDIPGLLMGKTGTTDLAGENLAVVFEAENGHPIVVVVLGSPAPNGRYDDMKKLVEAAKGAVRH
ncbi:MAG TPA: serine hydrolase [Candidatus Paceibacterota bacterium]|nr:serine hydrolase [Candidatus Paceibacterota bacterium]